jgi:hypothetical protein
LYLSERPITEQYEFLAVTLEIVNETIPFGVLALVAQNFRNKEKSHFNTQIRFDCPSFIFWHSYVKCEKCFGPPFCVVARRAMERKEDLNRSFSSVVEYALKKQTARFSHKQRCI